MPAHFLHNLLPNAHRIVAGHIHDSVDSAIGRFGFGKLMRIEWGQLDEQMLHLGLDLEVLDPRSQSLVLRDVTRPSAVREEFIERSWSLYKKKSVL